jgi:hypothetical protein
MIHALLFGTKNDQRAVAEFGAPPERWAWSCLRCPREGGSMEEHVDASFREAHDAISDHLWSHHIDLRLVCMEEQPMRKDGKRRFRYTGPNLMTEFEWKQNKG